MSTPTPRVRLSPQQRRLQLLDLGTRLFATRPVEEISIDVLAEEAGVSRGLLYHYFGNKQDFREAVIRHAVEDLVEQTAPPAAGDPLERLTTSVGVYVDYVLANLTGYRSLVRAAAGGSEDLRAIYEEARSALTDRIFREDSLGDAPRRRPGHPAGHPRLVGAGRGDGAHLGGRTPPRCRARPSSTRSSARCPRWPGWPRTGRRA